MTKKQALVIDMAREKGVIRPRDLERIGATPAQLRGLVTSGIMTRAGRGLYRMTNYEVTENHTLVEAARVQSNGVICLMSALRFHGIGTQLPHQVWVAIPFGSRIAKRNGVPIRVVVLTPPSYKEGIETHTLEGVKVPVYGIAKSIADCFKFRNKIGLDVGLEALSEALREKRCSRDEIFKYARVNRVEKIMRPYVEAMAI